ncbi:MAG: hypothetical protein KA180_02770 [Gemmatimonadales bacterium]|jgi:hypothetical protein|nr:hypothetical protein [Gemmatimonadales bacterium]
MSGRSLALTSLLVALSLVAQPAEAQLGGLTRKAKEKATQAAGIPSTDQPARMAGPEATPESIDHLLAGLKAEATVRQQQAEQERLRQEREEAARNASARQGQCYEDKKASDPAWPELQRLEAQAKEAVDKGDYNKASQLGQRMTTLATEMQARIQAACAAPAQPTPEQQAIQRQPVANPEQAGAQAAGMSLTDYAQFKELVYTYLSAGNRAGLADKEKQAVDAKKRELRERLKAVGLG